MLTIHNFVCGSNSTTTECNNTRLGSLKENDLIEILQSSEKGKVLVCGPRPLERLVMNVLSESLNWPMNDICIIGEKYRLQYE